MVHMADPMLAQAILHKSLVLKQDLMFLIGSKIQKIANLIVSCWKEFKSGPKKVPLTNVSGTKLIKSQLEFYYNYQDWMTIPGHIDSLQTTVSEAGPSHSMSGSVVYPGGSSQVLVLTLSPSSQVTEQGPKSPQLDQILFTIKLLVP